MKKKYSNDGGLIADIIRYGANIEVLRSEELARKVKRRLEEAAALYR